MTETKNGQPLAGRNVKKNLCTSSENNMNIINTSGSLSPPRKRPKEEIGKKEEAEEESLLSPEAKKRILANRLQAKITLVTRQISVISPTIGPTWFQALETEFEKPYFRQLSEVVEAERRKFTVYPSEDALWSWTTRTPIQDTRVVILGECVLVREGDR